MNIPNRNLPITEKKSDNKYKSLETQVGGNHYKNLKIQPAEFIYVNGLNFLEGNAVKYICRYKSKGGVEDLQKAKHYIEMLIEMVGVYER